LLVPGWAGRRHQIEAIFDMLPKQSREKRKRQKIKERQTQPRRYTQLIAMALNIDSIMVSYTTNGVSIQFVFVYTNVLTLFYIHFILLTFTANPDCWTSLGWEKSTVNVTVPFSSKRTTNRNRQNHPLPCRHASSDNISEAIIYF
jgi:hypothetical protein